MPNTMLGYSHNSIMYSLNKGKKKTKALYDYSSDHNKNTFDSKGNKTK